MTRLTDYTTEELERLTTLTLDTMRPGEFVAARPLYLQRENGRWPSSDQTPVMRLMEDGFCHSTGHVYERHTAGAHAYAPRRRVRSFTDATELDPPQAEMLTELKRRALRFRKGDTVVLACREEKRFGYIASVDADVPQSATHMRVTWDKRVDATIRDGGATVELYRLATPADIAAYEALIPKAQRFAVGDLVAIGDEVLRIATLPNASKMPGYYGTESKFGELHYADRELRPATDAEVAAYHRAHCQPKLDKPQPVVISNATHAGRRVKVVGAASEYVVVDDMAMRNVRGCLNSSKYTLALCRLSTGTVGFFDPADVSCV